MLTGLLALIVGFFTLKAVSGWAVSGVLHLMGRGVKRAGEEVAPRLQEGLKGLGKSKLSISKKKTAMSGFAGNVEDFGIIVFGSEKKMVEVVAGKSVEAMHEKLNTEEGRAEVAHRLAKISQEHA